VGAFKTKKNPLRQKLLRASRPKHHTSYATSSGKIDCNLGGNAPWKTTPPPIKHAQVLIKRTGKGPGGSPGLRSGTKGDRSCKEPNNVQRGIVRKKAQKQTLVIIGAPAGKKPQGVPPRTQTLSIQNQRSGCERPAAGKGTG